MDKTTKDLLQEFTDRYTKLNNEKELLKEDEKELFKEFKQKSLDVKTLKAAMKIVKIKQKVDHMSTLDEFVNELEG